MIYIYRKQLLIILIIIFLIVGGIIASVLMQPKKDATKKIVTPSSQGIKNLDDTSDFPLSDTTKGIVQSYITATMAAKHKGDIYTATARKDSYHRTTATDGSNVVSLLIDILPFKETYYFYRANDSSSQLDISVLRCAPEAQQIVHPSVCKDLSND